MNPITNAWEEQSRTRWARTIAVAILAAALASCGTAGPGLERGDDVPAWERNGGLRWGWADDPSIFDTDMVYAFDELPLVGAAENPPWPANYWPIYKDSINHRWDGDDTDSAAAKYGLAFGVDNVEEQVSRYHGIQRFIDRTECENDAACNKDIGESCAKRVGADTGRCIPTWWGICHAWAPAAILEGEPQRPVTRGDVTFKVNDIKALLTLTYNRTYSKFVSLRCNEDDSQDEVEYDEYGRPTGSDTECRDTNPGTFHIILANFLGLRQESFVEDRTFDDEVWNQLMHSFR
ncbi:MAG: hypothetical protein V3T05_12565, partial [Myxococcota bacterium]